ncbi:unnamed protein product, partial [Urochloa humidicola]
AVPCSDSKLFESFSCLSPLSPPVIAGANGAAAPARSGRRKAVARRRTLDPADWCGRRDTRLSRDEPRPPKRETAARSDGGSGRRGPALHHVGVRPPGRKVVARSGVGRGALGPCPALHRTVTRGRGAESWPQADSRCGGSRQAAAGSPSSGWSQPARGRLRPAGPLDLRAAAAAPARDRRSKRGRTGRARRQDGQRRRPKPAAPPG